MARELLSAIGLKGDGGTAQVAYRCLPSTLTAPAACAAFSGLPHLALLDSALRHPLLGRFSYLTADPFATLRSKGDRVRLTSAKGTEDLKGDPFAALQGLLRGYHLTAADGLPPFQGGAIGYLAYELAHHLERLPRNVVDDLGLPEMAIGLYDWVIAWDHAANRVWAIATGLPEGTAEHARDRLDWITDRLGNAASSPPSPEPACAATGLRSTFTRANYLDAVKAVKEYLFRGDAYQVNISQRFEAGIDRTPWELYLRLRRVNPAPFAAYLEYPEVAVLSASPEEFLRLEHGVASSRPMKGTRPRGRDPAEDRRLAAELLASEKERAENLMIVDLMRNDLGRACAVGSIQVPELFVVEQYARVFQMVSTVRGTLRPGLDAIDLVKACFPGGSVTGAPKIRAMEIIDELEPTERSVYCGAIGYIGFDGAMRMSVPIRILLAKEHRVFFQVGGGIVADSDPEAEYRETLDKARGSLEALGIHE